MAPTQLIIDLNKWVQVIGYGDQESTNSTRVVYRTGLQGPVQVIYIPKAESQQDIMYTMIELLRTKQIVFNLFLHN
jgi:hypothetical protein